MSKGCLMMMMMTLLDYVITGKKNSSSYCGLYNLLNCVIDIGYTKENDHPLCLPICSLGYLFITLFKRMDVKCTSSNNVPVVIRD